MSDRLYQVRALGERGQEYDIAFVSNGTEVVIGRARGVDFRVKDAKLSRRHARVWCDEEGRFWVQDMNSSNGTYVGDVRAHDPVELFDGSYFKAGDVTFEITCDDKTHRPPVVEDEVWHVVEPFRMRYGMVEPPTRGFLFDDVLDLCNASMGRHHAYADMHGHRAHLYVQQGRLHEISWRGQEDPFLVFAQFLTANLTWEIEAWEGTSRAQQGLDVPLSDFIEQFRQRFTGY